MSPRSSRTLLLCFDAFGTLFTPSRPIAVQYGEVARKYGITGFTEKELNDSFKQAYKKEAKERPNFGKAVGLKGGPGEWWGNVIRGTLSPWTNKPLPQPLITDLLTRFSTSSGYKIYPDVLPFFSLLREARRTSQIASPDPTGSPLSDVSNTGLWPWDRTVVGIVTNSDDRIPSVLRSLGVSVAPMRLGQTEVVDGAEGAYASGQGEEDVSFVVLSYDAGVEKPDGAIFHKAEGVFEEVARRKGWEDAKEGLVKVFVGDDVEKDVKGAVSAGWHGLLADRSKILEAVSEGEGFGGINRDENKGVNVIRDLRALREWKSEV